MKAAIIRRRIHAHAGVEGYALKLIHGLKKRGIEVGVIAEEYEPEQGIKFYPVISPASCACSIGLSPILFNRSCRKILAKEKFDVVHSLERTWPQDIYRAGEGCHAEFMKTLSLKDRLNPKHLLTLYTEKKAFLSSQYIMANSRRVKKEIISHYNIPEERIVVIYTGVNATPIDWCCMPKQSFFTVLFIGSGFKRKGLGLLIAALSRLDKSFQLLVAGKGNFTPYLKLADSLGIGKNVKFLGLVKDIDSLYARADLLILPSLYEPFSNVCLEAMACGIPALTTRCNGVSEILEEGFKELIIENPFDIKEMTSKIKPLMSKDTRQALSPKVRALAQKFSFSRHIDEVLKLYERIK